MWVYVIWYICRFRLQSKRFIQNGYKTRSTGRSNASVCTATHCTKPCDGNTYLYRRCPYICTALRLSMSASVSSNGGIRMSLDWYVDRRTRKSRILSMKPKYSVPKRKNETPSWLSRYAKTWEPTYSYLYRSRAKLGAVVGRRTRLRLIHLKSRLLIVFKMEVNTMVCRCHILLTLYRLNMDTTDPSNGDGRHLQLQYQCLCRQ